MTTLPARSDLEQLRRQAKELLRAAKDADGEPRARIHAVSDRLTLASAQLAIAREYGFASWPKLKTEVERRTIDSARLGLPHDLPGTSAVARALLDAGAPVDGQPGDPETPLITAASYGDADVARVLIEAGASSTLS
jgi:uncharacterized protein